MRLADNQTVIKA